MFSFKCFQFFSFLLSTLLILTQCTQKTSADYVGEGLIYTKNAQYDEALKVFKQAAELDPKNPDAHYGLGGIYNQKEDYHAAEKAFLITLKVDPTFIDAYYSLGYTYEKMNQKEKAQKYYKKYKTIKKKFTSLLEKEKIKH